MELQGEAYLFNLSIVAMTFAAVSVLVMWLVWVNPKVLRYCPVVT